MVNNNAAANTSSFFQQFRIVFGFIFELQSLARGREEEEEAGVVVAGREHDLEGGSPEEINVQTNRAVFIKALSILPTLPASFLCITLPGLLCLAQIKWQLPPLGISAVPSPTLHNWYVVCVTSLITELVASIAQWIISASVAAGP